MKRFLLIVAFSLLFPSAVFAVADLELRSTHIRFSVDTFVVGEDVRVYATVRNVGDVDTTGYVAFYNGNSLLGKSQVITVVANGNDEEVWADFTVPADPFNIYIKIDSTSPEDTNLSNNGYLTPLYTPMYDEDGDGVEDKNDNCPSTANENQEDTDGDGEGDACDSDDDNDSIEDDVEEELGTEQKKQDTDGDGVADAEDAYPTDASRSEREASETESAEQQTDPVSSTDSEQTTSERSQEDQTEIQETVSVDTPLLERASGAVLNVSPQSSFIYIRRDWKTYEFEALTPEGSYESLQWDFGDGTTSVQRTITHTFLSNGRYQVSLTVSDAQGNQVTDTQEISISIFHLANPMIQIILAILLVFLILSTLALRKTHRAVEVVEKKKEPKQEKAPPKKKPKKKTSSQ